MEQNLSLYYVFHTVAKKGSISHAAKELYISQPAISKSIQKLEDNLNTTLFKRSSRGVRLPQMERSFSSIPEMLLILLKKEKRFWHATMLLE